MNSIIALYVTAQLALERTRDRLAQDEGQTAVEWLGIAAVIAAIVVFLAQGPAESIGEAIQGALETLIARATGT